jgi:hypothetical protein
MGLLAARLGLSLARGQQDGLGARIVALGQGRRERFRMWLRFGDRRMGLAHLTSWWRAWGAVRTVAPAGSAPAGRWSR